MNQMRRHALSDDQWSKIKRFFPRYDVPGGQWKDHRLMMDGIMWVKCTGAPWRDLPERFGPWQTVYSRFRRWVRSGLFSKIIAELQSDLDEAGVIDWDLFCIDGTSVRAHKAAAGARKKICRTESPKATPLGAREAASLRRSIWLSTGRAFRSRP